MSDELTTGQELAIDALRSVLDDFADALNRCREEGLSLVDSFRAAGIDIPPWVPSGIIESMIPAPSPEPA